MSDPIALLLDVFRSVPHVMVCIKHRDGRYLAANEAFVRRTRRRTVADVVGMRAVDLFPPDLAASYDAQDRALFHTGQSVRNQVELIAGPGDDGRWYLTTKVLATTGDDDHVIVVASTEAQLGEHRDNVASGLRAAIELAHARVGEQLRVDDLAAAAEMSTDRLERAMRRVLGVSPKQYVLRLRADRAASLLSTTDQSIATVAAACGYYDQSQLTRQFRSRFGVTPAAFRAAAG